LINNKHKGAKGQRCKGTKVQRDKGAKVQRCKGTEAQSSQAADNFKILIVVLHFTFKFLFILRRAERVKKL
jgi:hypothetical protein